MTKTVKRQQETNLSPGIYGKVVGPRFFFFFFPLAFLALLTGFFTNFPVRETLTASLANVLHYQGTQTQLFPPQISFINPQLQLPEAGALDLDEASLGFRGLSFFPLGLRFHTHVKKGQTSLHIFPVISFLSHRVIIAQSVINTAFLRELLHLPTPLIQGTLALEGLLTFSWTGLKTVDFQVDSKDLSTPSQNLMGLQLPHLSLAPLSLKGSFNKKKNLLNVKSLTLGNTHSPLEGTVKGKVNIRQRNPRQSALDLEGKIKFSPRFLEDFSFVKLILKNKKQQRGYYPIKLKGSPAAPQLTWGN